MPAPNWHGMLQGLCVPLGRSNQLGFRISGARPSAAMLKTPLSLGQTSLSQPAPLVHVGFRDSGFLPWERHAKCEVRFGLSSFAS